MRDRTKSLTVWILAALFGVMFSASAQAYTVMVCVSKDGQGKRLLCGQTETSLGAVVEDGWRLNTVTFSDFNNYHFPFFFYFER